MAINTNSKEIFDFYEKQQRKLKKRGTVLQKTDRCTHIVHVKVMENMYSSRDFLIIILDASKLSPLVFISFLKVYYSIRYLHFSNANQNLRFVILRIFLITDLRKYAKLNRMTGIIFEYLIVM